MYRTLQQSYVDGNKTVCSKYSCTGREKMNLLIKRDTTIKNCNTYVRSFICYGIDTECDEMYITSLSITSCTEEDWDSLPYCITLQLCKYSSCYSRPQSSLYTHSSSCDGRQCGDSGYSILWWINFDALVFNIRYWSRANCGSLPTFCQDSYSVWYFCVRLVHTHSHTHAKTHTQTHTHTHTHIYICVCVNFYWYNFNYVESYSYNTLGIML
jgi:hypothetical protein